MGRNRSWRTFKERKMSAWSDTGLKLADYMPGTEEASPSQLEYFRALRTEIIEAQKLRIQVGLAKTVFLGTLIGFSSRTQRAIRPY
jgi:hypothetical protein